jgi:hypothetical protein
MGEVLKESASKSNGQSKNYFSLFMKYSGKLILFFAIKTFPPDTELVETD